MSDFNPFQPPLANTPTGPTDPTEAISHRDEKLVVLATFTHAPEAHWLRIRLEQQGIAATVANEHSTQVVGATLFGQMSGFWIEVLVFEKDAERALQIKQELSAHLKETSIPEWICECGATVDPGFAQCWSCMSPFPDSAADLVRPQG